MRKHLSLGLILASAMALSTLAAAGQADGMHGDRHGHDHGLMMAYGKLNLTDAQRASIKQITRDSLAANKGKWQTLRQQREAFEGMTPDQAGYRAAAANLAQAEGDAMRLRVQQRADVQAQIYAVLNPTQKAQLATMRSQRQARRQQWQQFKAQHPLHANSQDAYRTQ